MDSIETDGSQKCVTRDEIKFAFIIRNISQSSILCDLHLFRSSNANGQPRREKEKSRR